MQSNSTIQPSVTSPSAVSVRSLVSQQVMYQFTQMKTMLSSLLGPKQETTITAFCNYLASEVEALEDRDFQTFRNNAVTVTGKRGSNYRLSLSCNRKSKKLNLTNLFNSQQ